MLRLLRKCNSGVALIEFAVVLPVLLVMLLGMVELSRFVLLHQKVDKLANSMADFVTQGTSVSKGNLNVFAQAAPQIMRPFNFNGTIIFSSVARFTSSSPPCNFTNNHCVKWQYRPQGTDTSRIGGPGSVAVLPGSYTVLSGQNVIVAEVYYNYAPLLASTAGFLSSFGATKIYKSAIYKPRSGTLTTLLP